LKIDAVIGNVAGFSYIFKHNNITNISEFNLLTRTKDLNMEKKIIEILKTDNACVLITVFQNTSSIQLDVGSKMLISADKTINSFDDGSIDQIAIKSAHEALTDASSSQIYYDLAQSSQEDLAATAGLIGLFIEYIDYAQLPLFETAVQIQESNTLGHWLLDLSEDHEYKRVLQSNPAALLAKLNSVKLKSGHKKLNSTLLQHSALLLKNATLTFYVEPLEIMSTVLICGSGRLAILISKLAHHANFKIDVVDNIQENINYTKFPQAQNIYILPEYKNIREKCSINSHHLIVILTQDYSIVNIILNQVLHSNASYIGLSANTHRFKYLCKSLKKQGIPATELACIHCPIGINVGAKNIQETAFSVIAELIAARAGRLPRIRDV